MSGPEKRKKSNAKSAHHYVLLATSRWSRCATMAKICKVFKRFDVEPIVYIPQNPNYPITDASFLNDVPKNIKINKGKISEPYRFAGFFSRKKTKQISAGMIQDKNQSITEKLMLWVRGNFFIPDARKNWVKPSIALLTDILKKEAINTVITTGPPHSVHLIGQGLKENARVNWVADFRDPWTSIGYHKKLRLTSSSKKKHKELERLVLNSADSVLVTSETTKREFEAITTKPIQVITNGFDGEISSETNLDNAFTISHIGSMLTGRNPENLWQVLGELIQENKAFKKALKLRFVGVVSDDVMQSLTNAGLKEYVEMVGYVSHQKALEYQQKSQVLLLVEIDSKDTEGIIAGKLFEYLKAKRPILGIGPKNWEVAQIIKRTNTGSVFNYTDRDQLKSLLLEWFGAYQNKKLKVASQNIAQYSRKELTKKLAEHLHGYRS